MNHINYQTKSPILFLIFNRPDTTMQVFNAIANVRPAKLYIAADGPRSSKEGESDLCKKSREVINLINWDCEVKTLFRDINLGCKYAVAFSIDWFFENEEEGIILEDDCLPNENFFSFCDLMLEKYRYDSRIRHITGCNFQAGKRWGSGTYYFSNNTHVWGWASWKRAWKDYDVELSAYNLTEAEHAFSNIYEERLLVESWMEIFQLLREGKINTWDYQWGITNYFNNGLCIIPNYNLISNIGFREDGTHVFNSDDPLANLPLENISTELVHPIYFLPEKNADLNTLYRDFDIIKKKRNAKKIRNRIKEFFKT